MSVQSMGRGRDTHLIKITLGYEQGTRKRLYYTETFKGTKKEARLRAAELQIQHRRKKLILPSGMLFRSYLECYYDEVRPLLSLTCFYTYRYFIEKYLVPVVGDTKLSKLVKDDFQKVYDSMRARSFSPRTIRTLHTAAKSLIKSALKKRLLAEDILIGVALPKIPKVRPEFLTYEEMQAFFDVAPNYWYGNAFKFQFMTGLRNQELLALMWDDIDFKSATVTIKRACIWAPSFKGFKCTKTGDERTLSLDSQTIGLLNKVKAEQEAYIQARKTRGLSYGDRRLVFCNKGGRVPCKHLVGDSFKRILLKIGVTRRFRWYGARHTHATHLLDVEGANPKMIANRMGHSVEMLFRTYGHEMVNQQSEAVSKISSKVKL